MDVTPPPPPLPDNWFTQVPIDLEHKQYVLMGYLQQVATWYDAWRLYPPLADLIHQHRELTAYRQAKQELADQMPGEVTGLDLQRMTLRREKPFLEDAQLNELDDIVDYALPLVQRWIETGRERYETAEKGLELIPIGVMPLYKDEGYLLIRAVPYQDVWVFQYAASSFLHGQERLHALRTRYVTTYSWSLGSRYEHVKLDLVRAQKELPNPATYAVEVARPLPLEETLLPIAKRRLLRELANGA